MAVEIGASAEWKQAGNDSCFSHHGAKTFTCHSYGTCVYACMSLNTQCLSIKKKNYKRVYIQLAHGHEKNKET